jgi:small subunit ribosomal protein S8
MRTDPLSDLISAIRNANLRGLEKVVTDHSRLKEHVANVLVEEGYLKAVKVVEEPRRGWTARILQVYLKYGPEGEKAITGLKRVSTPGRRIFTPVDKIPKVLDDLGVTVLSTSKGVLSNRSARQKRVGGELLCKVW